MGVSRGSNSDSGTGVRAYSSGRHGVYAVSQADDGKAVYGIATGRGTAYGVYGYAGAITRTVFGVYGETQSDEGRDVYGEAIASSGTTFGVYGASASTDGRGVYGHASAISGAAFGVYGTSSSTSGRGVYGHASASGGTTYGVHGETASDAGTGVCGLASAIAGTTYGVYGASGSPDGYGVYGHNSQGGFAGYFEGDVAQDREADGLAKCAILTDCGTSLDIERSFNTVGSATTITSAGTAGQCFLDVGFYIEDRFWAADPVNKGGGAQFVLCFASDNEKLACACHDSAGAPEDASIMVRTY